jgi:MoxR-like ATPase
MATNPVEQARQRLLSVEKKLNELVVGHEDFVRALMLATVAGEHVVVIGPQGSSKSHAVRILSRLLSAAFYKYQLTPYSTYDEVFGAIDVAELAKSGTLRRRWSPTILSEFVFLDEVFKANSAILNSLLSLLQERVVYDPVTGNEIQAKLHSCIGTSNEAPEDPELQAFYDRFAVKVFISYLDDDAQILRAIEARWLHSNNLQPLASMDDVKTLYGFAEKLLTARIKDLGVVYKLYHVNAIPLVKNLRAKGVIVSDRTVIEKLPKLFSAYLALYGVTMDNVMNATYDLVIYTARTKDEVATVRKTIEDALGEVAELARKLEKAKELIRARNLAQAKKTLEEIINTDVNALAQKTPWMRPRIEAIIASARQLLSNVQQIEEELARLAGESA